MDRVKKIVMAFLNSAEGYFHTHTILQNAVKQPRYVFGPKSDRPEKWDYTDIRDIKANDLDNLIKCASENLDKELYAVIPSVALNAALQGAIHSFDNGRFQSKMDSNKYKFLYEVLATKMGLVKEK